MSDILIETRITAPRQPAGIVHRRRLLTLLKENADKSLILLCTSAGFGKTTLVQDFVSGLKSGWAWYYVTPDVNNFHTFYNYITLSLKKLCGKFGSRTIQLLDSIRKDTALSKDFKNSLNDLTATFINEFCTHFQEDVMLVIDDLHNIDSKVSGEWLNYLFELLFENMPSNLHLIITTREKPGFNMSKLSAKRRMLELTTDDLMFDKDEISELLEKTYSFDYTGDDIKILQVNINGWITGIHLILQAYGKEFIKVHLGDKLRYSDIFSYFANDIFEKLDNITKDFLLNTAFLENFDHELCNNFLEVNNTKEIITSLLDKNIFIQPTNVPSTRDKAGGGAFNNVYNYQELFKLFLVSKLNEIRTQDEINALFRKLFDFYLRLNDITGSINYGILAKQYHAVVPLIVSNFDGLFDAGNFEVLWKWLAALPAEIVNTSPYILFFLGKLHLYLHSDPEESLKYLSDALSNLTDDNDLSLRAKCYMCKTDAMLLTGKVAELTGELNQSLSLSFANEDRAKILLSIAQAEYRQGWSKYERVIEVLNEALVIANEENLHSLKTEANRLLGNIYHDRGELAKAVYHFERALSLDSDVYSIFRVMNNIADQYCCMGNYRKAKEYIDKITELYSSYPSVLLKRFMLRSLASFKFECGDFEDSICARKELNNLELRQKIKHYEAWNHILIGEAYYYLRNYDLASQNFEVAFDYIEAGDEYHKLLDNYLQSKLKTKVNVHPDVENVLLRALEYHEKNNISQQKAQIEFHLADYYLRCGMADTAMKYLDNCLKVSADRQYISFLEQEVLNSRSVFDFALSDSRLSSHNRFIRTLFENIKDRLSDEWLSDECKKRLAVQLDELNDLTMTSFGRLEFKLRGELIPEEKWIRKKSKLVLAYLLAKPDRVLTKDEIVDKFFQDVPLENADTVFHNTLSNMRTAAKIDYDFLNPQPVAPSGVEKNAKKVPVAPSGKAKPPGWLPSLLLYEDKNLCLNSDFYFKSDNIEFETLYSRAKSSGTKTADKLSLFKQAAELYKGEFLPGYYDTWCEEMRQNYANMFLNLCRQLIDILKEKKLYGEVITYSRMFLNSDKLSEDAYIDLIDAYVRIDNLNMAKSTFSVMLKVFDEELGEKPKKSTMEKLDKILA